MKIGNYKTYRPLPSKDYGEFMWMIKERWLKVLWKTVRDPSRQFRNAQWETNFHPYYFKTEDEAKDFIINNLIGKSEYREERLNQILKK